ncbi:MAG: type II secretion system secretin GspD [Oceanococcus sp.]
MNQAPRLLSRTRVSAVILISAMTLIGNPILAQAQADEIGSTLNLKDADIGTLIATVGEITGRNFIIDPRVKGKVTVLSTTPMAPDELYGVFLAVLQVHGFAAVPAGSVTKIVPEVGAKQDGGSHFDFFGMADDEIVTRVMEIQNVPAAQLVPILRPLVPQYGHLAAYSPSNMLIMSDRAANIGRLTQIIKRIDQAGDEEIEVIRLRFASAADVQQTLTGVLQSQQGKRDPSQQPITLVADERTNSLILSSDKNQRLRIRALIAHLDIPLDDDGDTQVIYLSYADAEKLAPILEGYAESQTQKGGGKDKAPANINGDVRIVAEPDTNALVITAPPKIMRGLRSVIAQLDIRRAQVLVEAILAEVSISKSRALGVDWALLNDERIAAASILDPSVISGAAAVASSGAAGAAGLLRTGFNIGGGSIKDDGTSFALLLNALAGDGETNVLSTPSLVTMDNEEAEISVGQEVPFLTGSFSNNSGGSNVNPFQTIERRDVGLTLGITPQINDGDSIQLTIKQESSNVSAGAAGAVDLITNKRTLNTSVMVGNGDILVLGGLIDDNVSRTEQKVPILGDIPLLGSLFRSTSISKTKQNLMIFIRSTILRDRESSSYYTRKKYDSMRDLQRQSNDQGWRAIGRTRGPELEELTDPVPAAPTSQQQSSVPAQNKSPAAVTLKTSMSMDTDKQAATAPQQPQVGVAEQASPAPVIQGNEPIITPRKKMGRGHLR